jgi:hypothetical protein
LEAKRKGQLLVVLGSSVIVWDGMTFRGLEGG